MSVKIIMEMLDGGMTISEILEEYDHLNRENILQAIRYAGHAVSITR